MKLLMISPMYPSKTDPVYGTFVKTYMDYFDKYNHQGVTKLVCIRGRSKSIWMKSIKYLWFYICTLFHLLFVKYDIIYVHTITTSIPPIIIASFFKHLNLVFNVHGSDVITSDRTGEQLKNAAKPLLSNAKFIVAPSVYFKGVVTEMFPEVDENNIIVSPSGGVDLNKFTPKPKQKDVITLGFVSRIDKGKGWDDFVDVIGSLRHGNYNVNAIMAGRGAEQDKMINMIVEKGLEGQIKYVGPVPHDDLPDLFNRFDVFVFPTRRSESLGLVGVEALACGIPVIGSNIAGILGYVIDGYNGFIFDCGSAEDLEEKVKLYIDLSMEEKLRMSLNARNSIQQYDTKWVMRQLYEKLKSICIENER